MRSLLLTLAISLYALALSAPLRAQQLTYEAFYQNQKTGELKVIKEVSDEREKIWIKGHYELPHNRGLILQFESLSTYMNGKLIESEATRQLNKNKVSSVAIWQKDGHYVIRKDHPDFAFPLLVEAILGLDLLFFEEPQQITHAFSLFTGDQFWIEPTQDATYLFKRIIPDKLTDQLFLEPYYPYSYEKGILTSFSDSFQGKIITFRLKE